MVWILIYLYVCTTFWIFFLFQDDIPELDEGFLINITDVQFVNSSTSSGVPLLKRPGVEICEVTILENDEPRGIFQFNVTKVHMLCYGVVLCSLIFSCLPLNPKPTFIYVVLPVFWQKNFNKWLRIKYLSENVWLFFGTYQFLKVHRIVFVVDWECLWAPTFWQICLY